MRARLLDRAGAPRSATWDTHICVRPLVFLAAQRPDTPRGWPPLFFGSGYGANPLYGFNPSTDTSSVAAERVCGLDVRVRQPLLPAPRDRGRHRVDTLLLKRRVYGRGADGQPRHGTGMPFATLPSPFFALLSRGSGRLQTCVDLNPFGRNGPTKTRFQGWRCCKITLAAIKARSSSALIFRGE